MILSMARMTIVLPLQKWKTAGKARPFGYRPVGLRRQPSSRKEQERNLAASGVASFRHEMPSRLLSGCFPGPV